MTQLSEREFGAWEKTGFGPEKAFLENIKKIAGVSKVETQTYNLMGQ